MPQGSTRVSAPLTNISVRYKNDAFIADQALKTVPVMNESDIYYIYNNDFRLEETIRANGAPSNQMTWEVSTSTYHLDEHAVSDIVTERDIRNVQSPLMAERDTVEYLTEKIQLREEYEAATLLFTTTTWSNNATLNTATSWVDNTTTSAPIQNVLSATAAIRGAGGGKANIGVTSMEVIEAIKENAQVYNRIQYVERAILSKDLIASVFDLDNIYAGSAIYNQGKEGATNSITALWGTDFLVANQEPNPRLKTRTFATMLRMSMGGNTRQVKRWRNEERDGTMIEVRSFFAPKAVATSSAYLFKTVTIT